MSNPEDERTPDLGDEPSLEDLQTADQLSSEYQRHMRRQTGKAVRRKPVEEVTEEFRGVLSWLMVNGSEKISEGDITDSDEIYLDYSAYDIEDTFFIVYEQLKGRRQVNVEDIICEHRETSLRTWQEDRTKEASIFLIIHGADETQINQWKSVEGTARQQRAMRRMHWLLQEPYMEQFKEFLRERATKEHPFQFADLAQSVREILIDGQRTLSIQQQRRSVMIPRKQEELDETAIWLQRALGICSHVFEKDIEDQVYQKRQTYLS